MHESTARVFIFTKNIPISLIFMNPLLHYLQLLRQTGATRSQIIIFRKTDELSYTRICQLERNRRERVFETWLAWEGESKGVPKHIIATWRCSELPREHQLSTEHVTVEGSRADLCQALLFNLLSSMEQTLHSWAWPKVQRSPGRQPAETTRVNPAAASINRNGPAHQSCPHAAAEKRAHRPQGTPACRIHEQPQQHRFGKGSKCQFSSAQKGSSNSAIHGFWDWESPDKHWYI